MCGIFGYIGEKENAAELVFAGLKRLEYRGYDSWGIAVASDGTIEIEKQTGKIGNAKLNLPQSAIGIGHTRWATHGGVTQVNAHPHFDCTKKIALLHNGIIENFAQLKTDLQAKGHNFLSETDTEVAVHLIEEYAKSTDFADAVQKAFSDLKGLNAILVMHAGEKRLVAAKTGSPLVIGAGDKEFFIASDTAGILPYTNKIIFLEDKQLAVIDTAVKLMQLPSGDAIEPNIQTIDWQVKAHDKGEYPHFFLKEIHEQPSVLQQYATDNDENAKKLAEAIDQAYGTFMIACGSASYAALFGTYIFSKIAKKHINFTIGSEFNYLEDYVADKTLVIPISQSGESVDVIEPVTRVKQKGARIYGLINVVGSTLYRMSDDCWPLNTGTESAVVATKSFLAMVAALHLAAFALANRLDDGKTQITKAVENIAEILSPQSIDQIKKLAESLKPKEHIYLLGRGISHATALEATLKLKESSYVHAEGFAGGELKHGVMALIDKGTPCVVFAPNDETYDAIISNAQEVKARGAFVIGIGPKNNAVFDEFIQTADCGEATIMPQVVVSQLLAYNLALARGVQDPDKPRNLAKSVTVK